jgi:hypothetical protein
MTFGATAHLALTYYYYPQANCSSATCQLFLGFTESTNGGATWSAPQTLAGPMALSSLANTSQGRMVGDYISTSFVGGQAYPAVSFANPPSAGVFDQALYTVAGGLSLPVSEVRIPVGNEPVVMESGELPALTPVSRR